MARQSAVPNRPAWLAPLGLALVLLSTFVAYTPAMHGGMLMDDDASITRPELRSLQGLGRIWFEPGATLQYYPLVHSAFWLEYKLWGDSVLGYHLANVFLHALSVVLLCLIVIRLKIPGALLVAAIFALHPTAVESVAWIAEQKNTLSILLYLAAIRVYLEFDDSRRRLHYLLAMGLFALALLSKTATVTLPAALLIIFWWQRGTLSLKRDVQPLLPFFALSIIIGLVTVWVERTYMGAKGTDFELTFLQRSLLAGRVIWFYLAKLFWPMNLNFIYPRWQIDPQVAWQWLYSLAAIGITVLLWLTRRWSRAPLTAWLYFCGTLFPVMGFISVFFFLYSYVADHLQRQASIGVFVFSGAAIAQSVALLPRAQRWIGEAVCIVLVGILAVLSWDQSSMYSDVVHFYDTIVARNPKAWVAHNNLGRELLREGKDQEAAEHYRTALSIKPNCRSHDNLGVIFEKEGKLDDAIREYRASLAITPTYSDALNHLGLALIKTGPPEEAIANLHRAIELHPEFVEAHNNLGIALGRIGKSHEAIEQFQLALKIDNNYIKAHKNLGVALSNIGDRDEAIHQFELALQLNPLDPMTHHNLAELLVDARRSDEAIRQAEQAVRLRPDFADSHNTLGNALRQKGLNKEAIEQYQVAIKLKPAFGDSYASLAETFAAVGDSANAIATAQKGISTARANNQARAADKLDEWLRHYQIELDRSGGAGAATPSKSP